MMTHLKLRHGLVQLWLLCIAGLLSPAQAQTAAEKLSSATVPFTLDHNRVFVEVELVREDGTVRKASAWVDLGSEFVTMAEPLARELGFDVSGVKDAERPVELTSPPPPVRLGGLPLSVEGVRAQVSPAAAVWPGLRAEVTLPASLLRQDHIVLDYPERRFTVARPGALVARGTPVDCRVHAATGLLQITATVDGEAVQLGVDNGSAGTWMSNVLTTKWRDRHPDRPRATGAAGSANFFGFPFESEGVLMRLPTLAVGPLSLQDVGVLGLDQSLFDWYSRKSAGPVVGFLGGNVLKRFRLEIDFPNQVTYWEAGPPAVERDLEIVGLTLRPESDGLYAIAGVVVRDGKPVVEGVLSGDKLISVDGWATTNATMGEVVEALRGPPGARRTLGLERDGQRVMVEVVVSRLP